MTFKRLGRENRILPFIVGGESNASDGERGFGPDEECFVPALRFGALGADGNLCDRRVEPGAADVRQDMTDLRT